MYNYTLENPTIYIYIYIDLEQKAHIITEASYIDSHCLFTTRGSKHLVKMRLHNAMRFIRDIIVFVELLKK